MSIKLKLILLLVTLSTLSVLAQEKLYLTNRLKMAREDELITINRRSVNTLLTPFKKYLEIKRNMNKPMIVQYDDIDGDGQWDEASFLCSFKKNETVQLSVMGSKTKVEPKAMRAHVRQMRKNDNNDFGANLLLDSVERNTPNTDFSKIKLPPVLTEGPSWENDKVGFRLYFDIRNAKDIWGKTARKMILDSVGRDPSVIYHQLLPWGMDIYKVGGSLSAGALAVNLKLPDWRDTLIRLGGKNMGKIIYRQIADGPVLAKFEVRYPEWQFADGYPPLDLTEEISIWGGQYFYESKVKIEHAPAAVHLVTGFANLYNVPLQCKSIGNAMTIYSYGMQSENKDNLGLAIMTRQSNPDQVDSIGVGETDIKDSYLVRFNVQPPNSLYTFRFYSGWSLSNSAFKTSKGFQEFLNDQMHRYNSEILMSWK